MGCGCAKTVTTQYVWTDGVDTVIYTNELAAKAKVMRKGGSYTPKEG